LESLELGDVVKIRHSHMPPEVTRKNYPTAFKKERAMDKRSLNTGLLSSGRLSRRESLATIALTVGGLALGIKNAFSATSAGISCSAATIHQEPVFAATPKRVFDALTDEKQFQQVQLLSAASKALDLVSNPAEIGREAGGAIKLYGGYISGWQLELEPEKRIVEAWRSASWPAHIYSIAKFELIADGGGTKIVFDQTGFPPNEAEHLASGWKSNYWDALTKYLA
jgi:uncharacterized protein YndB with AHSA1/START domain